MATTKIIRKKISNTGKSHKDGITRFAPQTLADTRKKDNS